MECELTAEFLESILRKYEGNDSISVREFQMGNAVEAGENFVADVKKVSVFGCRKCNGSNTDYKIDLIIKVLPDNPAIEDFLPVKKLFQNEIVAYDKLIPELKKYTSDGKFPVPDCVHTNNGFIVMKNLCSEGYEIIDKHKGFETYQIDGILKVLAKFHSASLIMSEKHPEKFKQLSQSIEEAIYATDNVLKPSQELRAEIAIKIFEELQDIPNKEKIYQLLEKVKNYNPREILFKERKHRVLNHGDTWTNNILIKNDNCILIDLQVMRYTSVASDLTYFLNVNVKQAGFRRRNFERFLGVYLEALNGHLEQAGCDLRLSMDWLKEEMREFSLYGISTVLIFTPIFCFKKEDLNVNLFDSEEANSLEFQWNLVTPAYKESVTENVLEYMKMFENC